MSAPGLEFREAEYLGLSFMAITSSELIDGLLKGAQLTDDDKHRLRRAKKFLEDVSGGARLVTKGESSNVSATETVRKLTYTVEPLRLIQTKIRTTDAEEAFQRMADAIGKALDSEDFDRSTLTVAEDFFHQLHISLVNMTEASKRRTGVSSGMGYRSFAVHA